MRKVVLMGLLLAAFGMKAPGNQLYFFQTGSDRDAMQWSDFHHDWRDGDSRDGDWWDGGWRHDWDHQNDPDTLSVPSPDLRVATVDTVADPSPEPSTLLLTALALLIGIGGVRRLRWRHQ